MANNGVSTNITFSNVRDKAATIKNCSATMDNMFTEFGNLVRDLIGKGAFVGSAADTFEDKFNTLKGRFDSYIRTVDEFSNIISSAASSTEDTQKALESAAQDLAS